MSTKHTPGPWEVIQKPGIGSIIVVKGWHLATVHSERDAALMGAAPELLEALRLMVAAHAGRASLGAALDEAQAAIARATNKDTP